MYLTKWDPFEAITSLQEDIDRAFSSKIGQNKSYSSSWLPAVDIHEDKESLYFDFELPGMKKEDVAVKVENNALTIKGEKKVHKEDKGKNFFRVEREYGSFSRSFSLPETADAAKINAEYKDGVLQIKIAKQEAAKPKEIEIKIA